MIKSLEAILKARELILMNMEPIFFGQNLKGFFISLDDHKALLNSLSVAEDE